MSTDATEADWQRVVYGLRRLGPGSGSVRDGPAGKARWDGRGDRAAAQAPEDSVVLEIWDDDGGAALRRRNAPRGRPAAGRQGPAVRGRSPFHVVPGLPTPARPPGN